ncbi:MAG: PAS domain S-box protein [Myxococcaceae bacterium]|nr:PAS domain S-box protein [Myxococcaceae bacterium]
MVSGLGAERFELALVDVTTPAGKAAFTELFSTPMAHKMSVVAIVESLETSTDMVRVAEVVTDAAVGHELKARLLRAKARAAMNRELQERQHDQEVLLDLTARYAETTDVEALLHAVTRRLAEEMEIDRAALVVIDELQDAGFIVAASDDAALKELRIELRRYPEIREVARTGKPVIVEDAPSHPLLTSVKESVAARGIQNLAALPLAIGGKVLGVLLLRRSSGRGAFRPREIDFLATVAHATAIALRNARLMDSLRGQSARDKTARIAAEEQAKALRRFEAYFEDLSDGVAILDRRAQVISVNRAACELMEVNADEVTGRHINVLTNSADDDVLLDLVRAASRGEVRRLVDVQATTSGGKRLTLSVSIAPLNEGDAVAIMTMRDVTRPRQMADELRHTKDFLERLIDSSVDAIIAADMKGRIILFNKAAEAICGWTADEAKALVNVRQLYPEGQARLVMDTLRSNENGGAGRLLSARQDIINRSGERIPVSMTATILYEGAKELATVGIFTDLRDRLRLERRLSDTESRLIESQKTAVLVALAGTTAHELNQPLTSVMGYAELLKRKMREDDPSWRAIDIIHREAERMAEIVRKIGKITRYETKAYIGDQQIVDLDKATAHED